MSEVKRAWAFLRSACIACAEIHEEEIKRVKEVSREIGRAQLGVWLLQHASFCAPHAIELKKQLLVPEQRAIEEALARHASELEGQLEEFLKKLKKGNHTGGGVLGRTAEFLACQRGILH
jgi:hypothetical protein